MTSIGDRLSRTRARIDTVAPVSHELHDYFLELLGIVERMSLRSVEQRAELEFLLFFLEEELEVSERRASAGTQEITVADRGLVGDGETDNGPALRNLIDELRQTREFVRVVFPPGIYYVSGRPGHATIEIDGLEHVTFEGRGSVTVLFDGSLGTDARGPAPGTSTPNGAGQAFSASTAPRDNLRIHRCVDLEFRNLSIDMRPVPFTVGTITAIEGGNRIVIEILPGYPEPDESYETARYRRGVVKDPRTGLIQRDCGDPRVPVMERLSTGRYRLTLDDNGLSGRTDCTERFETGRLFSLHPRQRPEAGNGITITSSRHLVFSRFNVYAADSHAYGIATSAGVKFLDCAVEPKEGRVSMTNADAFHCRSNRTGIYLERCRVFLTNDDCMNFYSKLASVGAITTNRQFTILQTAARNESMSDFQVGDAVAFINANTGETDGTAVIESITVGRWGAQDDVMCLRLDRAVPGILSRRSLGRPDVLAEREYTPSGADNYRAAMAIEAPFEHMILNLNAKNDGFIIRHCEMGHNRATGFKCKATNGVMRNTRFHDQVLLFQSEPDWQEGTFPGYLEVTDVVADKGIRYQATLPGKRLRGAEAARHIRGVHFDTVRDAAGRDVPSPSDVSAHAGDNGAHPE